MQRRILDRSDCFHTAIEIARHPVGRAKVILLVAAVCEIKRARMLEKSSHYADHANAVAHSAHARAQTADSTDYQIDFNASLRRLVQGLDHIRIHERIHLGDNAPAPSLRSVPGFARNQLEET